MSIYDADCPRICIENPVPLTVFALPTKTQCIQPYFFGDPYTKRTYLWLKGLLPLIPTNYVDPVLGSWVFSCRSSGFVRAKERSKTFPGIAKAMAAQWG